MEPDAEHVAVAHKKNIKEWIEATGDAIVEVGKEIKHLPSLENEKVRQHLQVKAISGVISVSSILSKYQQFIQTAVLEDYLQAEGFKVVEKAQFEMGEGQKGAFEYVDLEVDVNTFVKAVGFGHLFLTNEKTSQRFVLQLEDYSYSQYKLRVFSTISQQDDALNIITGLAKYAKEHNVLKGKKITPYFNHLDVSSDHTWDTIILPDETRKELQRNVNLLFDNLNVYKNNNLKFKRGLILKGPPGTGKTLIGKVLCNTTPGTTFIWVTPGDLDESRRIKVICELARELSPSILFLEDIDLYGSHRERANRGALGELMNQLDGLIENEFVVVIATTNRSDEIEDALRNRPGRFDRIIEVPMPNEPCRAKMFKLFLSKLNVQVKSKDELIKVLAQETDNYTGAHVRELIHSAIIAAIDGGSLDAKGKVVLKIEHFEDSIEIVKARKFSAQAGFKQNDKSTSGRGRLLADLGLDDDD